jgi:hypothetical protein
MRAGVGRPAVCVSERVRMTIDIALTKEEVQQIVLDRLKRENRIPTEFMNTIKPEHLAFVTDGLPVEFRRAVLQFTTQVSVNNV